jgi:hypothetical protein
MLAAGFASWDEESQKRAVLSGEMRFGGTKGALSTELLFWIREMGDEEIRQVGDAGPTIDSIKVQEFESNAEHKEWLKQRAPAFLAVKRDRGAPNRA